MAMDRNTAFLDGVMLKDAIDKAISEIELNSVLAEMGITNEAQDSEVAKAADEHGNSGTTGNYSDADKTLTASAGNELMASSSFGAAKSGGGNSTVEDILRTAMSMKPGQQISGDDIGLMNSKFSKAGYAIDNITKLTSGGVQVNLNYTGRLIVGASPDYSKINGAVFNLSDYRNKNGIDAVHIQSPTALYGGKPLNFYVNDNDFSIGGIWFSSLFRK